MDSLLQDQQVSKELVAIIAILVTMLNQMFALIRGKLEIWMESKNGGGIPRQMTKLISEIQALRSDLQFRRLEEDTAHKAIQSTVNLSHVMLSEWQRRIDAKEFACKLNHAQVDILHYHQHHDPTKGNDNVG